jgi:L-ribulokinase
MWVEKLNGLPPQEFWTAVDPLLTGIIDKVSAQFSNSFEIAGTLSAEWAEKLGLPAGIPIPVGAFDAHWDAIGAGCREGDVVNVVGTSTCIMAIAKELDLIPGVSGIVKGSVHPAYFGIEAGLSATGDIFDAIARRAGKSVAELSGGLEKYVAGQTGLLRMTWDNGDRTVLVNPDLSGMTLGWTLTTTAQDELFAAIEGTAFHTRIIIERMAEYGVNVERIINGGGIPQKNEKLNQVYANVLGKPVLVPEQEVTSLGSAIFAFMAAGTFQTIEAAQDALCPSYRVILPDPVEHAVYEKLFALYRDVYFGFGEDKKSATNLAVILPELRKIAGDVKR